MTDLREFMDSVANLAAFSGFWICFGFLERHFKNSLKDNVIALNEFKKIREKVNHVVYGDINALKDAIAKIEKE